jgi:pilus assembly protein FimV
MKEATLDDDFFAGEDAIGTKLDLAKAYMDMGDPDGARSILEEVLSEGNASQKQEAQRLMESIR